MDYSYWHTPTALESGMASIKRMLNLPLETMRDTLGKNELKVRRTITDVIIFLYEVSPCPLPCRDCLFQTISGAIIGIPLYTILHATQEHHAIYRAGQFLPQRQGGMSCLAIACWYVIIRSLINGKFTLGVAEEHTLYGKVFKGLMSKLFVNVKTKCGHDIGFYSHHATELECEECNEEHCSECLDKLGIVFPECLKGKKKPEVFLEGEEKKIIKEMLDPQATGLGKLDSVYDFDQNPLFRVTVRETGLGEKFARMFCTAARVSRDTLAIGAGLSLVCGVLLKSVLFCLDRLNVNVTTSGEVLKAFEWADKIGTVFEDGENVKLLCKEMSQNAEKRREILQLRGLLQRLICRYEKTEPKNPLLQGLRMRLLKIDRIIENNASVFSSTAGKMTPFCIYAYGAPGTGKTALCDHLFRDMAITLDKKDGYDPTRDKYAYNSQSEFFEGYNYQWAFVMDDLFQARDKQLKIHEVNTVIHAVDNSAFMLNMATLQSKGNVYFDSAFIYLTSNMSPDEAKPSVESAINSYDALRRRFHLEVEVRLKDNIVAMGGKVPYSVDNYEFLVQRKAWQTGCSSAMDYKQLLTEITERYIEHENHHNQLTQVVTQNITTELRDRYLVATGKKKPTAKLPCGVGLMRPEIVQASSRVLRAQSQPLPPAPNNGLSEGEFPESDDDYDDDDAMVNALTGTSVGMRHKIVSCFESLLSTIARRTRSILESLSLLIARLKSQVQGWGGSIKRYVMSWLYPNVHSAMSCFDRLLSWLPSLETMKSVLVGFGAFLSMAGLGFLIKFIAGISCNRKPQGASEYGSLQEPREVKGRGKMRVSPPRPEVHHRAAQGQTSFHAKLRGSVVHIVTKTLEGPNSTPKYQRMHALALKDHIFLIPEHAIRKDDDEVTLIKPGRMTRRFTFSSVECLHCPENHMYVINCGKHPAFREVPPFPNIIKKFLPTQFLEFLSEGMLLTNSFQDSRITPLEKEITAMTFVISPESMDMGKGVIYKFDTCVRYRGQTAEGDCGAPVIARMDNREFIVAAHIAISQTKYTCYGGAVTKEWLEQILEVWKTPAEQLLQAQGVDDDEWYDAVDSSMYVVGNLSRQLMTFPQKTKIERSIFYSMPGEVFTAPSVCRGRFEEDGKILTPLLKSVLKSDVKMVEIERSAFDQGFSALYEQYEFRGPKRLLSLEESIFGSPPLGIPSIDGSASVGWPWNERKFSRKQLLSLEERTIHPELVKAVAEAETLLDQGQEVPLLVIDCLKDERLALEKVQAKKTRIFSIMPIHVNLLLKRYYGMFCSHVMRTHPDNSVKVGMPVKQQAAQQFHFFLKAGERRQYLCGDISSSDRVVPLQAMMKVVELCNTWYNDEHAEKRHLLARSVFCAYHAAEKKVYRMTKGMPSGCYLTSTFNSLAYAMLLYSAVPRHLVRSVRIATFGDDHVVSLPVDSGFTMHHLRDYFATLGVVYTSPDKTNEMPEYYTFEEVEFLKRKFGKVDGRWALRMNTVALVETLRWRRDTEETRKWTKDQLTTALIDNLFSELALWGYDVWKTEVDKILDWASKDQCLLTFLKEELHMDSIPTYVKYWNTYCSEDDQTEYLCDGWVEEVEDLGFEGAILFEAVKSCEKDLSAISKLLRPQGLELPGLPDQIPLQVCWPTVQPTKLYCDVCGVGVTSEENMKSHIAGKKHLAKANFEPWKYSCLVCKVNAPNAESLKIHQASYSHQRVVQHQTLRYERDVADLNRLLEAESPPLLPQGVEFDDSLRPKCVPEEATVLGGETRTKKVVGLTVMMDLQKSDPLIIVKELCPPPNTAFEWKKGYSEQLERLIQIDTFSLPNEAISLLPLRRYLLGNMLFSQQMLMDRLDAARYVRFSVRVEIRTIATKFHYGALLATIRPAYFVNQAFVKDWKPVNKAVDQRLLSPYDVLHTATQIPHAIISLTSDNTTVLVGEWCYPFTGLQAQWPPYQEPFTLDIYQLTPAMPVDLDKPQLVVLAALQDVRMFGYKDIQVETRPDRPSIVRITQSITSVDNLQAQGEELTEIPEAVEAVQMRMPGFWERIFSGISYTGTLVAKVFGYATNVASYYGMSNPQDPVLPQLMAPGPLSIGTSVGRTQSLPTAYNKMQRLAFDTSYPPLTIDEFASLPTYIGTYTFRNAGDFASTPLVSQDPVLLFKVNSPGFDTESIFEMHSPASYLSRMFVSARHTVKIYLSVYASAMTSCRFALTVGPKKRYTAHTVSFNFEATGDVSRCFEIPYLYSGTYKTHHEDNTDETPYVTLLAVSDVVSPEKDETRPILVVWYIAFPGYEPLAAGPTQVDTDNFYTQMVIYSSRKAAPPVLPQSGEIFPLTGKVADTDALLLSANDSPITINHLIKRPSLGYPYDAATHWAIHSMTPRVIPVQTTKSGIVSTYSYVGGNMLHMWATMYKYYRGSTNILYTENSDGFVVNAATTEGGAFATKLSDSVKNYTGFGGFQNPTATRSSAIVNIPYRGVSPYSMVNLPYTVELGGDFDPSWARNSGTNRGYMPMWEPEFLCTAPSGYESMHIFAGDDFQFAYFLGLPFMAKVDVPTLAKNVKLDV